VALVVGIFSVAVGTGCGGGDDEATAETLTRAEFVKQANAICKKANYKRRLALYAFFEKHGGIENPDSYEELVNDLYLPEVKDMIDAVAALDPPPGDQAEVDAIMDAFEDGVAALEGEGGEAVEAATKRRYSAAAAPVESQFRAYDKKARAYGLEQCALSKA